MNNAMSLKAKIRNTAKDKNIPAQVILQNYMFERFLVRLSKSEYKKALKNIISVDEKDNVDFSYVSISPIRENDIYGGYCVKLNAKFDTIATPLSIDISTGDAITPNPVKFTFNELLDNTNTFELWAYNIETVLAEKVETILSRSVYNTRPRDFYDAYILSTTQKFDKNIFLEAVSATAKHRRTEKQIKDVSTIIGNISQSRELREMWNKYRRQFAYAKNIEFDDIVSEIFKLMQKERKE